MSEHDLRRIKQEQEKANADITAVFEEIKAAMEARAEELGYEVSGDLGRAYSGAIKYGNLRATKRGMGSVGSVNFTVRKTYSSRSHGFVETIYATVQGHSYKSGFHDLVKPKTFRPRPGKTETVLDYLDQCIEKTIEAEKQVAEEETRVEAFKKASQKELRKAGFRKTTDEWDSRPQGRNAEGIGIERDILGRVTVTLPDEITFAELLRRITGRPGLEARLVESLQLARPHVAVVAQDDDRDEYGALTALAAVDAALETWGGKRGK